jgi:CRISPR-associated endonuclease Csn1
MSTVKNLKFTWIESSRISLRNPVVEQVLNQVVNVVNGIIDTYGNIDEVRVELARDLKNNAKQRKNSPRRTGT